MKKTYIIPELTVVEMEMKQSMLAGSWNDQGETIQGGSGGDYGDGGITILSREGRGFGGDE